MAMTRLKKGAAAAFVILSLCMVPVPLFAANGDGNTDVSTTAPTSTTEQSTEAAASAACTFFVDVKSDIALSVDDVFSVTVSNADGKQELFEINGKTAGSDSYTLPADSYTVQSIEYKGLNPSISQSGYGVTKTFTLTANAVNRISLFVGQNQLTMAGDAVFSVTMPYSGAVSSTESTSGEQAGESSSKQTSPAENTTDADAGTTKTTMEDPPEEEVVEKVRNTEKEDKESGSNLAFLLKKGIFVFVVAIVIWVGSIIFFKKRENQ